MSWLLITQYKSFHPPSANLRKIHIFSFLTCIFSSDGKKRAETKIGDGEKRRGRNSGKDMRQSMLLLFASVYYTVENLCVRRRKLFDKRQDLHWGETGDGEMSVLEQESYGTTCCPRRDDSARKGVLWKINRPSFARPIFHRDHTV